MMVHLYIMNVEIAQESFGNNCQLVIDRNWMILTESMEDKKIDIYRAITSCYHFALLILVTMPQSTYCTHPYIRILRDDIYFVYYECRDCRGIFWKRLEGNDRQRLNEFYRE